MATGVYDLHNVETWTFEILRQRGVDLWMVVCALASLLAIGRVIRRHLWISPGQRPAALAGFAAGLGTAACVAIPSLHRPTAGMVWTIICLALVTYVMYGGMLSTMGARRGGMLLGLRVALMALLTLMLFEPVLRFTKSQPPDRPLYLVVDATGSMSVPDVQNGPSRIQAVWETVRGSIPALQERFDVRVRTFGQEMRKLDKPDELAQVAADGKSTDLVSAIGKVLDETPRKDAQIILISDGIDNTSGDVAKEIAASLRPIHTLAVGSEQTQSTAVQNIAIEDVTAAEELSVGHESKLSALVRSTSLANRVVDVKWAQVNEKSEPVGDVQSQKLVLSPKPEGQKIELTYKPTTAGLQRIAVWIDPVPGERTTIDNRQEFQTLALDPRIKVLYIEGRARPEYRELKRALDRDSNIEVATLLRIQSDRFASGGTIDGKAVSGIPVTAEAWRRADVIIIGDLDASFLTVAQQAAIENAVSEGSGFLMIGGQSSFGPGSYAGTEIEKVLPVFAGEKNAAQETTPFLPTLTEQGALHPAMEALGDWLGGAKEQSKLAPLRGNVVVPRAKPSASVLLVHSGKAGPDGKDEVVLATQQYGKGRSAAFTADTTYLWYLSMREMGQESPYNRFWGQLVRWLAGADVRQRQQGAGLDAMLGRSVYQLGEAVNVKALVRDERGDATRYATVQMELMNSQTGKMSPAANLSPAESRTGLYELRIPQVDAGKWTMRLTASKDGKQLGEQELTFTVMPPADELVQLAAKPAVMADISRRTNGWSYPLARAPELFRQLMNSASDGAPVRHVVVPLSNAARWLPAAVGKPASWPLRYDLPMQAILILAILLAEWLLRRKWQA